MTAAPAKHQFRIPEILAVLLLTAVPFTALASNEIVLSRDEAPPAADYKGIVDLVVRPGFDAARVSVSVDGDHIVEALRSPYRVTVDLGQRVIQHKIAITAWGTDKKRAAWSETINHGHLPLSVKLQATPDGKQLEALATAPDDDPIEKVELWDSGTVVATVTKPPYRFELPHVAGDGGFVQATARTRSGEEAADFWSAAGKVDVENVDVRTVPLYVSVVDRSGATRDDVDRSLFRIMDGSSEGKILQFSKAFDQPISVALVLDASNSMAYTMATATRAAMGFVNRTMKDGDRYALYSIREVPRREIALSGDKKAILQAIHDTQPRGGTALYDAIDIAVRDLKAEKNRRAIVVLTDGGDNDSFASWEDVEQTVREAGIPVYFIAFESLEPTVQQDIDRMTYLSTETGGFVASASEQTLDARYRAIEKDLRAQFAIVYQVTDFAKHNEWRKVRVVLNSPKLVARTIGGYFAP